MNAIRFSGSNGKISTSLKAVTTGALGGTIIGTSVANTGVPHTLLEATIYGIGAFFTWLGSEIIRKS